MGDVAIAEAPIGVMAGGVDGDGLFEFGDGFFYEFDGFCALFEVGKFENGASPSGHGLCVRKSEEKEEDRRVS